jgi:hypothetical protein
MPVAQPTYDVLCRCDQGHAEPHDEFSEADQRRLPRLIKLGFIEKVGDGYRTTEAGFGAIQKVDDAYEAKHGPQ